MRDAAVDCESKYWKFRHEKFQRGRPDLLSEIRKSNHTEAADKKEVDQLRAEVQELRSRIHSMAKDMEKITSLLQAAAPALAAEVFTTSSSSSAPSKKRKITPLPSPVGSLEATTTVSPEPMPVTSLPSTAPLDSEFAFPSVGNVPVDSPTVAKSTKLKVVVPHVPKIPPIPSPNQLTSAAIRDESLASLSPVDEEILTSLFSLEPSASNNSADEDPVLIGADAKELGIYESDEIIDIDMPDMPISFDPTKDASLSAHEQHNQDLIVRIKDSLSKLPKDMQKIFLDRLVTLTSHPAASQAQLDAITSLAASAAEEASKRSVATAAIPVMDGETEKNLELAASALTAFFSRCVVQHPTVDIDALDSLEDPLPVLPMEP